MRAQPLIVCSSVSASSAWYQRVLGFESAHGGDEYEMLTSDGVVVLQLHDIDPDEHEQLLDGDTPSGGDGVAMWFETDEYAVALARVGESGANVVEDDHVNDLAHHREIWLRDPDGYLVVISSSFGET